LISVSICSIDFAKSWFVASYSESGSIVLYDFLMAQHGKFDDVGRTGINDTS